MTEGKKQYCLCLLMVLLFTLNSRSQFGAPVFVENFGLGTADPNNIGQPLAPGKTSFTFSTQTCPPPGTYTVVRRVPIGGCSGEWIDLGSDYNSDFDPDMGYGNMMVVNQGPHDQPSVVYVDTINKQLCPGTEYYFSTAAINLDNEGPCYPYVTFPVLIFNIESLSGIVLFTDTTRGGLGYVGPSSMGYRLGVFGLRFTMPTGLPKFVIKIKLLQSSAHCGEDFALDEIKLAAAGPQVKIQFDGEPETTIALAACFQHSRVVTVTGTMSPFYTTPALQWQQSTDNGVTWIDIPGATSNTYTNTYSVPDTFLFRLSGAEAANIGNPNCRVVSNLIKLEIDGIPSNFDAINNSPVCVGDDLKFDATGGASYVWTGPNSFYDNIQFPSIHSASLNDSGWYYLEIITRGGCRAKDSTFAKIIGTNVDAWPDTAVCKGSSILLQASEGVKYEWSPVKNFSGATIINPRVTPETSTIYMVKVTDSYGCSDTATVQVILRNEIEVKAIIGAPAYLCRPYDSIQFFDRSRGEIESRHWNFGNGNTSMMEAPAWQYYAIPNGQNTFVARLAVMDTAGCTDTAFHFMNVVDNCYIAVPTAFTPNNDGRNDFLYPVNAYKVTDMIFRIYSRQGQVVFESRELSRKWDGKIGGVEQPSGAYVWMLDYTDVSGKRISLKGTTVLIR